MSSRNLLAFLQALLFLAIGILACVFSHRILHLFHYLVSGLLFFTGGVELYLYFSWKNYLDPQNPQFKIGVLTLVAAILIFLVPERSLVFICVVWGSLSILKAVNEWNRLIQQKLQGERIFLPAFVSLVELVLGIILILELTNAIGHHIVWLGISIINMGVNSLLSFFRTQTVMEKEQFYP